MAQWKKNRIQRENGEWVDAQAPLIISASRSTDIPAFYADWFFHRMKVGYSAWTNPFNGVKSYVSYNNTRFIVFWSKNPRPLLDHFDELEHMYERYIPCYIQYSLNDYEKEGLEKNVRPLGERIETFQRIVERLGVGHVVWRFDPLVLLDNVGVDELLRKIENIGDQLKGYTEKLVFSYADIAMYKKVKANLDKNGVRYREWDEAQMNEFAQLLSDLNRSRGWNYKLATCGERIDISKYGIQHNKCVDDDLMIRFAYKDNVLMDFLGVEVKTRGGSLFGEEEIPEDAIILNENQYAIKKKNNADKGQRLACHCAVSKDIGEYNTCVHLCEYCYANSSKEAAARNWNQHKMNLYSETITGR